MLNQHLQTTGLGRKIHIFISALISWRYVRMLVCWYTVWRRWLILLIYHICLIYPLFDRIFVFSFSTSLRFWIWKQFWLEVSPRKSVMGIDCVSFNYRFEWKLYSCMMVQEVCVCVCVCVVVDIHPVHICMWIWWCVWCVVWYDICLLISVNIYHNEISKIWVCI